MFESASLALLDAASVRVMASPVIASARPPILDSNARWTGPGHNSVVSATGHDFIVHHAWSGAHACSDGGNRELLVDRIGWRGGGPFVNSGTPGRGLHTAPLQQH